jgi:hypothetical protein
MGTAVTGIGDRGSPVGDQGSGIWDRGSGIRAIACAVLLLIPTLAAAGEHYALIMSGASGGAKYVDQQKKWCSDLGAALKTGFAFPDANVVVLGEDGNGPARATAENARRILTDLRRRVTAADVLLIVLFGHGTFDGDDAKFNLVGPDLSAAEWRALLDPIPGRLIVVNTTESSFPFLDQLSRKGRVIITATDSVAQRYSTVFPEYFVRSLLNLSSDFDKDRRVSVWEAFTAASDGVKSYYEQKGQLSTERPLLDDDGDRVGREAETPGEDGRVARTIFLDPDAPPAGEDAEMAALGRHRAVLQSQLDDLRNRKDSMTAEQYQQELEKLLVQIARIDRRIRDRS